MNIGIYLHNVGDHSVSKNAFTCLNGAIEECSDACLFFDNIGAKPEHNFFSMFNSTDLWFFKGKLVVTFLEGLKFVDNTVNNKEVFYHFNLNKEQKDLFGLLSKQEDTKIIAEDEESYQYIKRVTNKSPIGICKIQDLYGFLKNEHTK